MRSMSTIMINHNSEDLFRDVLLIDLLKNLTKFTGEYLCRSHRKCLNLRLATLLKRDSGAGVFL